MYRNSGRIFKKLKRIIFILFLMIYIGGCGISKSKYKELDDWRIVLENEILSLNSTINEITKENERLENILDIYLIINYKLHNDNDDKNKEITFLKKSNITEITSEVFKLDMKLKSKLNSVIAFIYKKYEIYPNEISLTVDDEFTNICLKYSINKTSYEFEITIYTDLSISFSSKDILRNIQISSSNSNIENLDDLEKLLSPLF